MRAQQRQHRLLQLPYSEIERLMGSGLDGSPSAFLNGKPQDVSRGREPTWRMVILGLPDAR